MQQTVLNLLGCSSFSALVLVGHAALAETVTPELAPASPLFPASPLYGDYLRPVPKSSTALSSQGSLEQSTAVSSETVLSDQADCSCQAVVTDPDSDAIGDLAIDRFGCDCAGCRNTVMRMAQLGESAR